MTVTYISTVISGTGPLFAYAADSDSLVILSTGALLATSGTAISASRNDVNLHLYGTVVGATAITFSGNNASIHIYEGGSITSLVQNSSGIGIDLWTGGNLINEGTITGDRTSAIVMRGSTSVTNLGTITGVNGAFVGLNGSGNVDFVNAGTVTATDFDDAAQGARYNNGLVIEGLNSRVMNTETGVITAISSEGAGIFVSDESGGSTIGNWGTIQSLQSFGVDMRGLLSGQGLVTVQNWGTISGGTGSYNGSQNADSLVNQGEMLGAVDMGLGNDTLDNRGGTIEGAIDLGDGDDTFFLGAGVEIADGGSSLVDAINVTTGAGGVIDLTNEGLGTGLALGDILVGFERVYGSKSGVDIVYGNTASNLIYTYGGDDVIYADLGADAIYAGRGADTITGGAGNDTFGYQFINEFGDTITDFSSTGAGNDDRFTFRASNIGGGLVAGPLDPAKFQARADNVADANDRFIFRTTDTTLWFDVDGAGGVGPVMVADLQAGATVTAADIILV